VKSVGRLVALVAICVVAAGCAPADESQIEEISQQELRSNLPEGALILDVRTQGEFDAGHVPGAMNISHDELATRLSELDSSKNRPIVVYCRSGKRAAMASSVLLEAGYLNLLHLEGDMNAWHASGLPTETSSATDDTTGKTSGKQSSSLA
jgi:rhodanese-related sulfurtransferase